MSTFLQPEQYRAYFASRLPVHKFNGHAQISTNCPFHSDSTPSLSVNLDKGTWMCHAGCGSGGVLQFEEKFSNCDHDQAKHNVGQLLGVSFGPEPEAIYLYRNALGKVVFRKLRYRLPNGEKTFICEQPKADGKGWEFGLKGIPNKPLYHLPELAHASYVLIPEGEKDCDRLISLNLSQYDPDGLPVTATTNFSGAEEWQPEYGAHFIDKQVVILPDRDQPGEAHALAIARNVAPFAAGVKICYLPELPEHGDVSDYLDTGHTAEELVTEIANSPAWQPDTAEPSSLFQTITEVVSQSSEKAEWVIARHVERTGITGLGAKIKLGKTSLMMSAFKTVLQGTSFLGYPSAHGAIVLVTEMAGYALVAAVERAGLRNREGLRIMQQHKTFGLTWPQIVAAATEECKRSNAVLLAIDTLSQLAAVSGDDENSAGVMAEIMRPLQRASGQGFGIWYAAHERKSGGDVSDAIRGSSAAGGCADILMSLGKPAGNHRSETVRKISSVSRFPETPTELVIDWTLDNEYAVLGDGDAVVRDRATAAILAALPLFEDCAKTVLVLQEETGESRRTIGRILREELKANRKGSGDKGDPFKYWSRIGGDQ